jgi:hypothetical protein
VTEVQPEPGPQDGAVEVVAVPGRATAFAPLASVVTGSASVEVGGVDIRPPESFEGPPAVEEEPASNGVGAQGSVSLSGARPATTGSAAHGSLTLSGGQSPPAPPGDAPQAPAGEPRSASQTATARIAAPPQPASVSASGTGNMSLSGAGEATVTVFDWETAARGVVQEKLEEVVTLMDRAQLLVALQADDRLMAEAIKAFFSTLTKSAETPDKDVVQPQARWLVRKLDVFTDSMAAAGGTAAASGIGIAAASYVPQLHALLVQLATNI